MRAFQISDWPAVIKWMKLRKQEDLDPIYLPKTGLIINNTACGFLIKTDNSCGILDFFISNPEMQFCLRNPALEEIASALIDIAKRDHLRMIVCNSKSLSIQHLAKKLDFNDQGKSNYFSREL